MTQSRRETRESVLQGIVTINGENFDVVNWSTLGYSVRNYTGPLNLKDSAEIHVKLTTLTQQEFEFDCKSIIVRIDHAKSELAGVFVQLPIEIRKQIDDYFTIPEEIRHSKFDTIRDYLARIFKVNADQKAVK